MIFFRKTRRDLEHRLQVVSSRELLVAKQRLEIDDRLSRLDLLLRNRVEGYEHIAAAWAE